MDKLDRTYLQENLIDHVDQLIVYETISSTNDIAKQIKSKQHKTLIIAEHQTNGRGTQARRFYSEKNKGIYASYIIDLTLIKHHDSFIPIIMACAVAKLCDLYQIKTSLKWINDVFIKNAKCAGILCETISNESFIVIGVGINVFKQVFPEEISKIATTMQDHTTQILDLNMIVVQLFAIFSKLINKESIHIINDYLERYKDLNKCIDYKINSSCYQGLITGIDEYGRLNIADGNTLYSNSQILSIYESNHNKASHK